MALLDPALDLANQRTFSQNLLSLLWTRTFERHDGWRGGDGGKSIGLAGNRALWVWGDSAATSPRYPATSSRRITGSTLAISDRNPGLITTIAFYARTRAGQVFDITTGLGVDWLDAATPDPDQGTGGWETTGQESQPSFPKTILWYTGGIAHRATLYLFYQGVYIATDKTIIGSWDGTQYMYKITNTDQDPGRWTEHPRIQLPNNSMVWTWFYDDTSESPYVYAFGLVDGVFDLHVARFTWDTIEDYSQWEFLRDTGVFQTTFPVGAEAWVRGNDSNLRTIATNVGIEFSVDHLIVNGVSRWLLVHSKWVENGAQTQGIFRVSGDDTFLTFPNEKKDWFWVEAQDIDHDLNTSDPNDPTDPKHVYDAFFRGFSLHAELSGIERNGGTPPFLDSWAAAGSYFPVLMGYTLFWPVTDKVWSDVNCAIDHPGMCGARRFGIVDLASFWPKSGVGVLQSDPTSGGSFVPVGDVGQVRQGVVSAGASPATAGIAGTATTPALHAVPKRAKPPDVLPNLAAYLTASETTTVRELASLSAAQLNDLAQHALSYATPEERAALRGTTSKDWSRLIATIWTFRRA